MAEIIKKKISELKRHSVSLSLISLALIIAISGMFAINGSLGWYAHNDEVSAEGMSVDAKTTPNLVIGKSPDELMADNLQFSVSYKSDDLINMTSVTHEDQGTETYLKYLVNHYAVDESTGNAKNGMSLEFAPVPITSDEVYFVDYTVYIASRFDSLEISSLTASITLPTTVDSEYLSEHVYFNAASIDFYVSEVSLDNYRGTTSVSDSLNGTARASIELFRDGVTVPDASSNESIKIIMRCYFDGALQDTSTNRAYINSNTVKTDGINIGVTFTAIDAVTEE